MVLWRAQFWELPEALGRLDWFTLIAVVSLNFPVLALWALRSHLVLVRLDCRLPIASLLPITTLGNVAGTLTPAGVGDLLRSRALKDKHGLDGPSALGAVLYERFYLPLLLVVSLAVAAAVQALENQLWAAPVVVTLSVVLAAGVGSLYSPTSTIIRSAAPKPWLDLLRHRGGWVRSIREADKVLRVLFGDLVLNFCFALITGVVYWVSAVQVWLLVDALGGDISLMEGWIAYALGSLASLIFMLPGGLGFFDASFPAILNSSGVDFLSATAATLLLRGLQTLPLGLLAVFCHILLSRQRSVDSASEEPERAAASEYSG